MKEKKLNILSDFLRYKTKIFDFNELIDIDDFFITSDLHFNHENVIKHQPETRCFLDVKEMNESLIEHWNSIVPVDGKVIMLGDFHFKAKKENDLSIDEIISKLNGTIYWVYGNHDKHLRSSVNGQDISYVKFKDEESNGIVGLVLSHFPMSSWDRSHWGSILLFGHEHGSGFSSSNTKGNLLDCGYDAHGRILKLSEAITMARDLSI